MPRVSTDPTALVRRHPERARYDAASVQAILDEALFCHVGVVRAGRPVVVPMAHGRDGDALYLHGSAAAGVFRDLRSGSDVCVTATVLDGLVLARSVFHHSMNYRSAVVHGTAEPVDGEEKERGLRAVTEHAFRGRWDGARRPTAAELRETGVWRLPIDVASAKVRRGGPLDDPDDLDRDVWAGVVPVRLVMDEGVQDVSRS